jgi:hypothetical protein
MEVAPLRLLLFFPNSVSITTRQNRWSELFPWSQVIVSYQRPKLTPHTNNSTQHSTKDDVRVGKIKFWAMMDFGSGICSDNNLTKEGAIFIVIVPAIKIRSTYLGVDLGTNP